MHNYAATKSPGETRLRMQQMLITHPHDERTDADRANGVPGPQSTIEIHEHEVVRLADGKEAHLRNPTAMIRVTFDPTEMIAGRHPVTDELNGDHFPAGLTFAQVYAFVRHHQSLRDAQQESPADEPATRDL